MIRVALRQFRTQALVAAAAIVAVFAVAAITRFHLVDVYDSTVAGCGERGDCPSAIASFLQIDSNLRIWLGIIVMVVPGLIGVFWGAPLVARELEQGTFRLAWTQSVTRGRWLGAKLGVVGLGAAATAGLLSLVVTWWASLLDRAGEDLYHSFDQRGLVPIGHAVFAFVVGVTAGVVLRRTLPAMATTLVVFVTARLAFVTWVRPNLFATSRRSYELDGLPLGFGSTDGGPMRVIPEPPHIPNAWVRSVDVVDAAGRRLTSSGLRELCPTLPSPNERPSGPGPIGEEVKVAFDGCVEKLTDGYRAVVRYHPSDHYWGLQWIELGLFVGGAVLLAGLCWWWVTRRLR